MGRSPPLPHHPQRRRQRGTAGAQYAGRSGLINIKRDDALLHLLTGHYLGLQRLGDFVTDRPSRLNARRVTVQGLHEVKYPPIESFERPTLTTVVRLESRTNIGTRSAMA